MTQILRVSKQDLQSGQTACMNTRYPEDEDATMVDCRNASSRTRRQHVSRALTSVSSPDSSQLPVLSLCNRKYGEEVKREIMDDFTNFYLGKSIHFCIHPILASSPFYPRAIPKTDVSAVEHVPLANTPSPTANSKLDHFLLHVLRSLLLGYGNSNAFI